jgi:hypothetical protein
MTTTSYASYRILLICNDDTQTKDLINFLQTQNQTVFHTPLSENLHPPISEGQDVLPMIRLTQSGDDIL